MDYKSINKKLWNDKVDVHMDSDFYNVKGFIEGQTVLNSIELDLLGDVKGKSILHLQCHFGQDSIELGRMGAQVTGVDLSDKAIDKANWLADQCGVRATFYACDVYDAPSLIDEQFDIVFTSYGTVGWLPDMKMWANVISNFLKPGGTFVFADFHPVVWMMDYDFKGIGYAYFNTGAIVEELEGTYTDRDAPLKNPEVSWNHSMGEVLGAILECSLKLNSIEEFDYSPYDCFRNTVKIADRKFQIRGLEGKLPMVYAFSATKSAT